MGKKTIIKHFAGRWNSYYEALIEGKLKPLGRKGEFKGICPFHRDTNPSLTVNQNTGFWKCFGCDLGGDSFDFWAKLKGLSTAVDFKKILAGIADQFNLNGGEPERSKRRIDKAYSYTDETGKLLFQTVRYEPKDFRQRQPDGKNKWKWNLKGVRLVPYQLPKLIKAQEVLLVEGEKDTDNLIRLGFCATTVPMGAGKWRPEYAKWFQGKDCILIPDCDKAGREHMNTIAASLQGEAASIKLLGLPDLPEKGDVSDWIAKQPDPEAAIERLSIMIENAKPWTTEAIKENNLATGFAFTDMGNAERLVARHGKDIRFCYPWAKWMTWTGKKWGVDESGEVERRAKETVRTIAKEITVDMDGDTVQQIYKHAGRSEADGKIQAMIKLARSEVPVMPGELDHNPYLMNVINGTLDLEEGKLFPHKRESLITKMAPVEYEPGAECPLWMSFLDRIMNRNTHLIEFLQRTVGYSLTGDMAEQCFLILYGIGANGKTTFLETIRAILGDYAHQADFKTFLTSRNDSGISNDVAALKGARFVSACEAGAGRSLNEALIKQLTGGEPIRARFLYGEFFEFHPTFKIFLATNHKPRIRNQDLGIWRRIRLVPFNVVIPKEEQDLKLIERLREESAGVLNWALRGCQEWLKSGLGEPEEITVATSQYREEMDNIGVFIEDKCILGPGVSVKTSDLKKAYQDWCSANGEEPINRRVFAEILESRGCKSSKSHGVRTWKGIDLLVGV